MQNITLSNIPDNPGIYLFKDKKDNILYIGKAKNLQKRVSQYFSPGTLWKQEMMQKAEKIDFMIVQNESEALYLEDNLIKQYKPEYNNLLKADNSYTYIKITKHPFPEIYLTRKKRSDGSVYIGPKHNTILLKKLLQYLRQILQRRGCKNLQFNQKKLCSDYYFGLCKGRCALQKLGDYDKIADKLASFFKGNTGPIELEIRTQIQESIDSQHFERAGKLRDILVSIQQFTENQTVVLQKEITGHMLQIKSIGNRRIYVIIYIYKGKVIDVIRQKISQSDHDYDSLISNLSAEYGDFIKYNVGDNDFWINTKQKINKSEFQELNLFFGRCFDSFIISTSFEEENLMNDLLQTLKNRYLLKNFPYRIECLDISHLSGDWTSGGLTCMLGGLKYLKGYRRYKLENSGDDYLALKQCLTRRLSNKENLPDLFVLDGGEGQLGVAKEFAKAYPDIQFISLGKGEARNKTNIGKIKIKKGEKTGEQIGEKIYYFDQNFKIKNIPLIYDQADKILLELRNEAHRFSNNYRKKQMSDERK